jgi:hypothetical protein
MVASEAGRHRNLLADHQIAKRQVTVVAAVRGDAGPGEARGLDL